MLTDSFSTFEVQTFVINLDMPILCALICRPPKLNKDFLLEFAEFVGGLIVNYDRLVIAGDFNIHVCCESSSLVKEFLDLVESFNLTLNLALCTKRDTH